jgi:hypothetical protein
VQATQITARIREFGFNNPILVNTQDASSPGTGVSSGASAALAPLHLQAAINAPDASRKYRTMTPGYCFNANTYIVFPPATSTN